MYGELWLAALTVCKHDRMVKEIYLRIDHILKLEIYKNIDLEGGKSINKSLQVIGRTQIF